MYDETNIQEKKTSEVSLIMLAILFGLNLIAIFYYASIVFNGLDSINSEAESFGVGFAAIFIPLFLVFLTIPYAVLSGVALKTNTSKRNYVIFFNIISAVSILLLIAASFSVYPVILK